VITYNHSPSSETCPHPYRVVDVRDDAIIIARLHVTPTRAHETLGIKSFRTEAGPLEVLDVECGYIGDEFVRNTGSFRIRTRIDPDGERALGEAYRAPEAIEDEGADDDHETLRRHLRGQAHRERNGR
jgi:hypothetical protein